MCAARLFTYVCAGRPLTHVCTAKHGEGKLCLATFALQLAKTNQLEDDGETYKRHGIDDVAAKYEVTPVTTHLYNALELHSGRKQAGQHIRKACVALVTPPEGVQKELVKKLKL